MLRAIEGEVLQEVSQTALVVVFVDRAYFLCDVEAKVGSQQLDDYEAEERFTLEYVDPTHAIHTNREVDHGPKDQIMLEREARVLEIMIQEGIFQKDKSYETNMRTE